METNPCCHENAKWNKTAAVKGQSCFNLNLKMSTDPTVQVLIRVKPHNVEEGGRCVTVDTVRNTVSLACKPEAKLFTFDHACGEDTTQDQIFTLVGRPLVEHCLRGFNCTAMCYGQTGSGKTFTMQGNESLETLTLQGVSGCTDPNRGLISRMLEHLFLLIGREERKAAGARRFLCKVSFLEIYNEHLTDLLAPTSSGLQVCVLSYSIVYESIVTGFSLPRAAVARFSNFKIANRSERT